MSDERLAIPSSGNDAEDERRMRQFLLHHERMQQNICPNGCGTMNWIDAHNRQCAACGFAGFSTRAFDMKEGQV